MTGTSGTAPRLSRGATLDSRGWLELAGAFLVLTVLFSLLTIDLVRSLLEDPGFGPRTLLIGVGIGAAVGGGLTALLLWSWRRGPGRPAQRLGRHAWREGHLPSTEPARGLAVADLQRRERVLMAGYAPLFLAGVWALTGTVQIVVSDSWLHTIAWLLFIAVFGTIAVRAVLDRRRLPQLRTLLEHDEAHHDR